MKKGSSFFREFSAMTLSVIGALIFNIGGVFTGRTAVLLNQILPFLPWIFLVYPLLLTVRGDINGVLSSRLGSALHLGTIKPSWRKNTQEFKELLFLVFIISFYDAMLVSIIGYLASVIFKMSSTYISILAIAVTTFMVGSTLSVLLTFSFTFFIFKRNGDPDVYVYPIMSTANDFIITIIYFLTCIFYRPWKVRLDLWVGLPFVIIIMILLVTLLFTKFKKRVNLYTNIKQTLPALTITTFIAIGTGSVLTSFEVILKRIPIFIVIFPAVISTVGAQSSMLANSTTTKLHLGTLEPKLSFIKEKDFIRTLFPILSAGIIMSLIYSVIGISLLPSNLTILFFLRFLLVLILTNIFAFTILGNSSAILAVILYRFGLDPDNLVVPLLSTFADLITTLILVVLFQLLLL